MEGCDRVVDWNSVGGEMSECSDLPEFSNLQSPATGQVRLD